MIGFVFIFFLAVDAQSAQLTAMRMHVQHGATRIIFNLDTVRLPRIFSLSHPERVVIDFQDTRLTTTLKNNMLRESPIKNIRIGYPAPHILRIVLDLSPNSRFKVISAHPAEQTVIDIYPETSARKKISVNISRPLVIVIDPGHGGRDPGAVGVLGTKEKNVTLSIAKQLADLLNREPHTRAVLTRKGNYFVPLRDRLKLARKGNADVFIAIHADSYFNTVANGASVYALSQHGATSEAARCLAKRDNYSELGGVDLSGLSDQSYLLRSVLIDLAQTATINDSLRLGRMMLSQLKNVTVLHYSRVEQAPFMVLKSPDIPSVLVEMGFLSNREEEKHLRDKKYRTKMAEAIFASVYQYLQKYHMGESV